MYSTAKIYKNFFGTKSTTHISSRYYLLYVQQRQKYLGVANGVKAEDFFSYKMNCESCKTIRKCIFPHSLHTAPFCQPATQTLEHTFV